jgi:hypothetical protein
MRIIQTNKILYCLYDPEEVPVDIMNQLIFERLAGDDDGARTRIIMMPASMAAIAEHHQQKEKKS